MDRRRGGPWRRFRFAAPNSRWSYAHPLTSAQPLDIHGPPILTEYRSPTPVPNSHACEPKPRPATAVGAHTRWTSAQPGHPRPISHRCTGISNARTQLSRLRTQAPTRHSRWSYAHPLDKRTAVGPLSSPMISNARIRWHPSPDPPQPSYAHLLDKRTAVGHPWPADTDVPIPTPVPNSHACAPKPRPATAVGVTHTRWTSAQPLDLHGPPISHRCTDLQRPYPTLTPAHPTDASRPTARRG